MTHKATAVPMGLVLSYHRIAPPSVDPWGLRVSPENFAAQIAVLRSVVMPVSLETLTTRLDLIPDRKMVALTFDDGYVDNLTHALPALADHGVPATVFITTGSTSTPYFWWEALEHVFLLPNTLPPRLALERGTMRLVRDLGQAAIYSPEDHARDTREHVWRGLEGSRLRLFHDVYDALWPLAWQLRMDLVSDIIEWSGLELTVLRDARPMTGDEVKQFSDDPLITIGNHTVRHRPLDEVDPHAQLEEIRGAQSYLAELIGKPVRTFAYPHGKHDAHAVRNLAQSDHIVACTTQEAVVAKDTERLLMPRFTVKNWTSSEFHSRLTQWLSS